MPPGEVAALFRLSDCPGEAWIEACTLARPGSNRWTRPAGDGCSVMDSPDFCLLPPLAQLVDPGLKFGPDLVGVSYRFGRRC